MANTNLRIWPRRYDNLLETIKTRSQLYRSRNLMKTENTYTQSASHWSCVQLLTEAAYLKKCFEHSNYLDSDTVKQFSNHISTSSTHMKYKRLAGKQHIPNKQNQTKQKLNGVEISPTNPKQKVNIEIFYKLVSEPVTIVPWSQSHRLN